ncbi:MAG: hypothetical protein K8T26_15335 [Lentisphaerae bacterium]|nr:hypothetical protein [Lentisphaerota bacterium]
MRRHQVVCVVAILIALVSGNARAQYSGQLYGPANVDDGSTDGNLNSPSSKAATVNGNIRYQWRLNGSGNGTAWVAFNWDSLAKEFSFYGNPTFTMSDDVTIRGDMDIGGTSYGWGHIGNFGVANVESTKQYIFNVTDTGSTLSSEPGTDVIQLGLTEINHQAALASTPDGSTTGLSNSRSGNNIVFQTTSTAENSGSNEELWYQWTVDNFTTKNFVQDTAISANESISVALSSSAPVLREGDTLKWVLASTGPSSSGTVSAFTGGLLNFDVIAINKSSVVTYSVTDDDTTAPALTAFTVADQTDAAINAGGYTIGGSIQDTGSGVNNNGATVSGDDFSPNYDLLNNANTQLAGDQVFTTRPADGAAQGSTGALSASAPGILPANIDLGTYKIRVSATDNDEDPSTSANDRTAVVDSQVTTFTVTDDDSAGPDITGFDFPASVDVTASCIVTVQINDVTGTTDNGTTVLYYGYGVPATPLTETTGSGDGEYTFTIPPQTGQGGNTLKFYVSAADSDADRTGDAATTVANNGGSYYSILITVTVPTTNNATWDGGDAVDSNWASQTNWVDDARPETDGKATLNFAGALRTYATNDYTAGQQFNGLFFSSGAASFTLRGNSLSISNKIENNSVNAQTIETAVTLNAPATNEVNPVDGDLTLGAAVTVNSADLVVYSDDSAGGNTVRFGGTVSQGTGSSKLKVRQNATVEIAAANTLANDIEIDRGAIHVEGGGSVAAGTAWVGNGTLTGAAAEFVITDADGGTTVARTMNINDGTAGNRTLGGANSSGVNTFSGNIGRSGGNDKTLTLTATGSGVVDYTGSLDGDDNVLVQGGGVTRFSGSAKSYTGDTVLSASSTLRLNGSPMLADTTDVSVGLGSTFDLNNNDETVQSIAGAGNVALGSALLIVDHTSSPSFTGVMSGTGGFVKKGTGTLTLGGANSYNGQTYIVGGVLQYNVAQAGGFTGALNVGGTSGDPDGNATLAIGTGGVTLSNPITVRGGTAGTRFIRASNTSGTSTFSGPITMNNDLTIAAQTSSGALTISGPITLNAYTLFVENTETVTIGSVTGSGILQKSVGVPGALIVNGAISVGNIYFNDGNIRVVSGGDLETSSVFYLGASVHQNDTTLELAANGLDIGATTEVEDALGGEVRTIRTTVAGTQTMSGTVRQDDEDLILSSTNGSTLVLSGTMDMDYDVTVDGENDIYARGPGDITFSGQLNAANGGMDLFTQGSGTVTLSGNNSGQWFQLEHGGGTLFINNANGFGTSYIDKLKVNASGATTRIGVSSAPASLGILFTGSYTHTIQVDSGVTFTVPNTINDGVFTGNLLKTGDGDLTVQSVNALDGTVTVNGGTLHVSSGASFGTTAVNAGGYLKGNGTVGTLSVSGTVAPGASVGTLNAGATTFGPSGTNAWDVNDFSGTYGGPTGWDKLNITGALNITATAAQPFTIQVWSLNVASPGNAANFNNALPYTLKIATASGGISGFAANKFAINAANLTNPTGGGTWSIQQNVNDLELVFTPFTGIPATTVIQFK